MEYQSRFLVKFEIKLPVAIYSKRVNGKTVYIKDINNQIITTTEDIEKLKAFIKKSK